MPRQNGNGSKKSVSVYFYGDDILAALELDPNETYVPIGRLCEMLGLSRAAQEKRVKTHAVLSSGVKTLRVEAGNGYEQAPCLRADLIPLWLMGLDVAQVAQEHQARLELFQREATSTLWQAFKPQGFTPEDALLPSRHEQSPAEHAYVAAQTIATLARHQMLIERQINASRAAYNPQSGDPWTQGEAVDDTQAALLARAVRRVATTAAERTRRNEYAGIYSGLYRQFSISSYRRMPASRLHEAMEWLDRWRGDLLGEPEPPPDI